MNIHSSVPKQLSLKKCHYCLTLLSLMSGFTLIWAAQLFFCQQKTHHDTNITAGRIIYCSTHFKFLTHQNNHISNTDKIANIWLLRHLQCMRDPTVGGHFKIYHTLKKCFTCTHTYKNFKWPVKTESKNHNLYTFHGSGSKPNLKNSFTNHNFQV